MEGVAVTRAEFAQRLGAAATDDFSSAGNAPVVIDEQDPVRFRRQFAAAAAGRGPVFLTNPEWGSEERAEFDRTVSQRPTSWDPERGWLMIPTGGTTGGIKLARHDQHTIGAAVAGFAGHFGLPRINAVGVLPLHHVGGLMGWLRVAMTGGEFRDEEWKQLETVPPVDRGGTIGSSRWCRRNSVACWSRTSDGTGCAGLA